MNTLVLLLERNSAWSPDTWATQQGGVPGADGQVIIERGKEWLSVVRDDEVLADFDDFEMQHLKTMVSEPAAYLLEWRGCSLLESLLKVAAHEPHAAIDNDHGLLVPVREVADKPTESWVRAKRLP